MGVNKTSFTYVVQNYYHILNARNALAESVYYVIEHHLLVCFLYIRKIEAELHNSTLLTNFVHYTVYTK
jgi:hypothetical protein